MTFDDIRPYQQNPQLPQFAKLPTSLKNFLGINAEGQQNAWGKAMSWIDPIGSAIGNKVVADKYFRGTDFYDNQNNLAKESGLKLGVEALTAADVTKDFFTGNFAGIGKDVMGLGKTIAHSGKTGDMSPQGGGAITQLFAKAFPKAYNISGVQGEADHNYKGGKLTQMNNLAAVDVSPWLANLLQKPKTGGAQDAFQTTAGADQTLEKAPNLMDNETPMDITKGASNMDWGGGFSGISGLLGMMREGGTIQGSTHEEGGVALIDTKTGKDIGLRVEGGERIVNDRDYNTVKGFLRKGHYKKALALLEEVEDRKPAVEFKDGGTIDVVNPKEGESFQLGTKDNPIEFVYKKGKWIYGDNELQAGSEADVNAQNLINKGYEAHQKIKGDINNPAQKYTATPENTAIAKDKLRRGDLSIPSKTNGFTTGASGDFDSNIPTSVKKSETQAIQSPKATQMVAPNTVDNSSNEYWKQRTKELSSLDWQKDAIKEGIDKTMPEDGTQPATTQPTAQNVAQPAKKGTLADTLDYATGTGLDALRLGAGLVGANKKLQDFKVPQEWADYMNKARYFSELGLSPEEKAMANLADQTNYGQAVQGLTSASGGNAGALMGNLSRVNAGRGAYALALASKDTDLKRANFEQFLPILNEDIGFKKDAFERKYNQDLATKQAGAQLASDALSNMKSRMDYAKSFGPNSPYAQLTSDLEAKGKSEAEILKAQADFWKNPANMAGALTPYNSAKYLQ